MSKDNRDNKNQDDNWEIWRGKNCIGGTSLGLNRSLGPYLCHFQFAEQSSGNFSYKVNLVVWEILTAESASVRARYALNLAYFIILMLVFRFFHVSP